MGQILKKNAQYIFYLHIFIYLIDREKGGRAVHIFLIFYTHHRVPNDHIWWQLILIRSQIIIWSCLCDQNWWNIIKKNRYEFSSAFIDQRLPNMVQRLFADVITWRDLAYEYSWAKVPMISGYGKRRTGRKPPTCCKSLINFIT